MVPAGPQMEWTERYNIKHHHYLCNHHIRYDFHDATLTGYCTIASLKALLQACIERLHSIMRHDYTRKQHMRHMSDIVFSGDKATSACKLISYSLDCSYICICAVTVAVCQRKQA